MSEQPIVIETHKKPDSAVIFLHGLGADAFDLTGLMPALQLPENMKTRFVFPRATKRPITLNNGIEMRGWYDIKGLDRHAEEDAEGIDAARRYLTSLIQQQVDDGISPKNIILAGFSQGGAVALATGLQASFPLGGILALSSYLPLANSMPKAKPYSAPILMMHGEFDDVIRLNDAKAAKEHLQALGYQVVWRTYPMAHQICQQQFHTIRDWMVKCLTAPAKQPVYATMRQYAVSSY